MGTSPYRCCAESCVIAADHFSGPLGDPGCIWDERRGNWQIVENEEEQTTVLREAGTPDALLLCTVPNDDVSAVVIIKYICTASGKYRIIVNYVDDDNYYFAEHDPGANRLSLNKRAGGTNEEIAAIVSGCAQPDPAIKVCLSYRGTFSADIDGAFVWECVEPFADGDQVGLGNGSADPIDFTDFSFSNHVLNDSDCEYCLCTCGGHCIAKTLKLTIYNISGCQVLDGSELTLYLVSDTQGATEWAPDPEPWVCGACEFNFRLQCSFDKHQLDNGCHLWALFNDPDLPCSTSSPTPWFGPFACDCHPFTLSFQAFIASLDSQNCCETDGGSFYVVITE